MHAAAGGPPVVVERLAKQAQAAGCNASVLTTSQFCQDDGRALEAALRQRLNATVLPHRPVLLGLGARAKQAVNEGVRNAGIVHIHTLWHPLNTAARRACARHGRPYVLAPHGMLDPYSLGVKALRKRVYLALIEGRNLRGASRLIFTTPLEEQLARASLPWLGEGAVIPLGADGPPPDIARETLACSFAEAFPQAKGRRCLIFFGRLHPKKGIERIFAVLPEIVQAYPDILLVVAGMGEAGYVAGLKETVESGGLANNVLFAGHLEGRAKWGALAAAEAFLLPSHQENFALAAAEAMHMGLPVILSDKVNIWPFVTGARAGIVLSGEAVERELKTAMLIVLDRPEEAREMGMRGREFARGNFDWRQAAQATCELYGRVLNGG